MTAADTRPVDQVDAAPPHLPLRSTGDLVRLGAAITDVRGELVRIDAKAGTLLALAGAGLALLVGGLTGRSLPIAAAVAGWTAAAALTVSAAVLALAVRPSLPSRAPGSLFEWAQSTPAELVTAALNPDAVAARAAAGQLAVLSGLAVTKFRRLRAAVDLLLLALALTAFVPVLALVCR